MGNLAELEEIKENDDACFERKRLCRNYEKSLDSIKNNSIIDRNVNTLKM